MKPPADTSAEAHEVQMAVFRRMTGAQRLAMALELSDAVRRIAAAGAAARARSR